MVEPDLSFEIAGKSLSGPVGIASGTFGFGEEYTPLMDYTDLGAIFTKAVTLEPREGNQPPRLAETPGGLINAIGLANPGLKAFLKDKVPVIKKLPTPAIVNVAGAKVSDYVQVSEAMEDCDSIWGIELNVSCPNVDHGGLAFGTDPRTLAGVVGAVRRVIEKPLIVKLSPNVTDIGEIAVAAVDAGADALSCINTVTGMKIDINARKPVIPRGTGGLSGPAIRPVGVAAVWRVSKVVKVPIIGLGGIAGPEDALEYLLAGASMVQVGTALFSDPDIPSRVLQGIRDYLKEGGFDRISDLHGFF